MRLNRRALDILCALAAAKGEIVGKDELMAQLWPGRIVEEGNIHVHVSALRKALDEHGGGHSYIVTVPGRGYRLVGMGGSVEMAPTAVQILPLPDKPSIAVLPFQNMSGDPEQEYLRRRHGRGHHHRAVADPVVLRHRAQLAPSPTRAVRSM